MITIQLVWFKPSGKYYTEGEAVVSEADQIWTSGFKNCIRETQNGMESPWWDKHHEGWKLLTDTKPEYRGPFFALHLWDVRDFAP